MNQIVSFEYKHYFSESETDMLKTAEIEIKTHLDMAGQHLIEVGNRLIQVKDELAEKNEGFVAWCNSEKFPLGHSRALEYMAVSRELGNTVHARYLGKNGPGHFAIARLATMKDEDIRAALLEHIEKETEQGHNVTRKEVDALKKALKDERARSEKIEESAFDAKSALQAAIEAREKAERIAAEKEAAVKRATENAIETDRLKRKAIADMEAEQKRLKQELDDAEEVYRDQLEEMRKRILKEERSRPRTDAEKAARAKEIGELEEQAAEIKIEMHRARKEREDALRALHDTQKEVMLRDKLLGHFQTASADLEKNLAMFVSSAAALRQIPMTDELYQQIHTMIDLMQTALNKLEEVTNVTR